MRIIQSFWSLPAGRNNREDPFGRSDGGWLAPKYHAFSWALSYLKFKEFYPLIELYTDREGGEWLINKLGLPYHRVVTCLDNLAGDLSPDLWAMAKLHTCLLQEEPFLHADGDIFIWKPFSKVLLESQVFVQNIEFEELADASAGIYINSFRKLKRQAACLPPFMDKVLNRYRLSGRIDAYNTGIFGGQNTIFIRRFARYIFDFLDRNKGIAFASSDMNLIEQLFLYCVAEEEKIPVSTLSQPEKAVAASAYSSLVQFNLVPMVRDYIHVIGLFKKDETICSQVAMRLRHEYPKVYRHINALYKEAARVYVMQSITPRPTADRRNQAGKIAYPKKILDILYKEKPGDFLRYKFCLNSRVNIDELTGWEALLCYFDQNALSGDDLIKLIKDENWHRDKCIEDLPLFVCSFLTLYSLHYNYLKMV